MLFPGRSEETEGAAEKHRPRQSELAVLNYDQGIPIDDRLSPSQNDGSGPRLSLSFYLFLCPFVWYFTVY